MNGNVKQQLAYKSIIDKKVTFRNVFRLSGVRIIHYVWESLVNNQILECGHHLFGFPAQKLITITRKQNPKGERDAVCDSFSSNKLEKLSTNAERSPSSALKERFLQRWVFFFCLCAGSVRGCGGRRVPKRVFFLACPRHVKASVVPVEGNGQ